MAFALVWLPSGGKRGDAQRSFFGVYRVQTSTDGRLPHADARHDAARRAALRDEDGQPVDDTMPTTYYYPGKPDGRRPSPSGARCWRQGQKGRYGIVGLGTGSSACHKREGETWRFFEIDPAVISIAKNPKNFTFITKCQPEIDIVIGDARLTMAKEPDESFDLFIIDAFTSDAMPVHMLTTEAVKLFLAEAEARRRGAAAHLQPLPRPGLGAGRDPSKELPAGTAGIVGVGRRRGRRLRAVDLVGGGVRQERGGACSRTARWQGVSELDDGGLRAWTDDYSDILGPFLNRLRGRG